MHPDGKLLQKPGCEVSALLGSMLAHRMNSMNVFEEFKRLVLELEKQGARYALDGGVAMAFYTERNSPGTLTSLSTPMILEK
jgi:hypothetical protein